MVLILLSQGCGKPDRAAIELRKQIQTLENENADLKRQREGDLATLRAYESHRETVATLPQERLDQLFTTHGLKLGRLTGGADTDPSKPGDEVLKVYVVPTDQRGDLLKAAGSFVVEAFDLSLGGGEENRLGRWEFTPQEAEKGWIGDLLMYGYTLECPWQRPPQSDQLTVRVTFRDALTGREFTQQKVVTINPPRSEPATAPAASR